MKKIFGILLLIVGLVMIGLGIAAIVDANSWSQSIEGQLGETFSYEYRNDSAEQKMVGAGLAVGGLIVFIIGISMLVTKTKAQRKQEIELALLKKTGQISQTADIKTENTTNNIDEKLSQLEKLGKLMDQGLLTQEEFQIQKNKILD